MLVAINGWFYNKPYTGIGQYTRNLIRSIASLPNNFKLIVFINASDKHYLSKQENDLINVDFIAIDNIPFKNDIVQTLIFERKILKIALKMGVNVLHTPYLYAPFKRNGNIKHVITIHDAIQKVYPKYRGGYIRNKFFSFREQRLQNIDTIITVSEYSKNDIKKYLRIGGNKINVIYESVDGIFQNNKNISSHKFVKNKYALPDNFIFYIGGFDFRKNVSSLLKAYSYLKNKGLIEEKLIIGGKFSPTLKQLKMGLVEDIPSIIKELNLEKNVKIIGFIPQSELVSFYKLAKVSIYPSLYEGFGLPVLEAMYCGTPVIASNTSSIPEIINREDLLFDPSDPQSISEKILWVLSDKDLQTTISKWAVERAKNFTWNIAAKETMNVYSGVLIEK